MAEVITQDLDTDEVYFASPQERIAYEKGMARAYINLKNPRDDIAPPIEAPRNQATFTQSGGIVKPIGLKEVADLYSVSPAMSNLRGKGDAPDTGEFGLSIFEGAGGTTRIVGKTFIDRWDDSLNTANGLFSRPDYSWDNNDNTSIGGDNKNYKGCWNNWYWLVIRLLNDPSKVIDVKKISYTCKTSHVTKDDISGKKSTEGAWKPQYIAAAGGWGYGKTFSSKATSTNYKRHIKTKTTDVVINGAINGGSSTSNGWPSASDWDGVKRWVASGFFMNFANGPSANGQFAWPNAFSADIDITVKI